MKPPPITLSGTVPTVTDHETVAAELEDRTAQEALEWMFETLRSRALHRLLVPENAAR